MNTFRCKLLAGLQEQSETFFKHETFFLNFFELFGRDFENEQVLLAVGDVLSTGSSISIGEAHNDSINTSSGR